MKKETGSVAIRNSCKESLVTFGYSGADVLHHLPPKLGVKYFSLFAILHHL
jgi:hypothetical protein